MLIKMHSVFVDAAVLAAFVLRFLFPLKIILP